MRLVVLMLLVAGACGRPDAAPPPDPASARPADPVLPVQPAALPYRLLPTAEAALRAVVWPPERAAGERAPRVLGIGEVHQTARTAGVRSALSRFTAELLPALSGHVTDIVIESWIEPAGCDAPAARASAEVTRDIERPASTEDELVTLVERARGLRIRPHLLSFGCDDYRALRGPDGAVDYEALLSAVTVRLRDRVLAGLGQQDAVIALYGGALHNDLYPNPGVADFSYAAAVDAAVPGAYVEIDLIVSEYVIGNTAFAREPWYALIDRTGPDHVVLIERAPRSYVLLLPRAEP